MRSFESNIAATSHLQDCITHRELERFPGSRVRVQNSSRKTVLLAALCLSILGMAKAQEPLPAGRSSSVDASVGYAYLRVNLPSSGYVGMNGIDGAGTAKIWRMVGVRADLCYAQSGNLLGSRYHNDWFSYLGGPVAYPYQHKRTSLYAQALIGGARLAGVNAAEGGGLFRGMVNKVSWSFGGGGEFQIDPNLAVRAGGDYIRAAFFDQAGLIKGEWNGRATVTLVYTFGRGHRP
jgi:opacity protein-like surface antigen